MGGRRESVGRLSARTQSASEGPVQQMVSVAVLPPRLKSGLAPPTGIAASGAISWDESLNWQHNEKVDADEEVVSKRKGLFRKAGLTSRRQKANPDTPPFVLRQIPYDTWRKHYAKDKDGNYRGTHAPAEDCLLKPHDVEKWRLGEAVTKADKWTRGSEALPVYAEVKSTHAVPEYEHDYDGPPRTSPSPPLPEGEDYLDLEDNQLVSHFEKQASKKSNRPTAVHDRANSSDSGMSARQHSYSVTRNESIAEEPEHSMIIADGKTAKEIIAEAEAKGKQKQSWKTQLHNGVKMASFGGF